MNPITDPRELRHSRHIPAPPSRVFDAWTRPELLLRWFSPKPVVTVSADIDLRPGGKFRVVMRLPDGTEMPHEGLYLEVVPGRRLVSTSAFRTPWEPAPEPRPGTCEFPMVLDLSFEPEGDGTRYVARALHWTMSARDQHEQMGFDPGWNQCTDQMIELLRG